MEKAKPKNTESSTEKETKTGCHNKWFVESKKNDKITLKRCHNDHDRLRRVLGMDRFFYCSKTSWTTPAVKITFSSADEKSGFELSSGIVFENMNYELRFTWPNNYRIKHEDIKYYATDTSGVLPWSNRL